MHRVSKFLFLFAVGFLAAAPDVQGVVRVTKIDSLVDCPEGMIIFAESHETLLTYTVLITPDLLEGIEGYRGRITSTGRIDVRVNQELAARSDLKSGKEGEYTAFRFTLSEAAASESKLFVTTHLHEKDGLLTVGGGTIFEISTSAFMREGSPALEKPPAKR